MNNCILPAKTIFFVSSKIKVKLIFDNNLALYDSQTKKLHYEENFKYLFFDTETIGLPVNWDAPETDIINWPRMVQIAWILCDSFGDIISSESKIIKPDGFIIPQENSEIHRITTERANKHGSNLEEVLMDFNLVLEKADFIVAHNMNFDEKIVGAEFIRKKIKTKLQTKEKICTMQSAVDYCKLSGQNGYKWPKLSELYFKLFGEEFQDAHDALVDIKATAKCFWRMREIGLI